MFHRQRMRYSLIFFAVGAAMLLLRQTQAQRPRPSLAGARAEIDAANYESLQGAIDALPTEGGCVRIPAGRFEIAQPLVLEAGDVLLTGQGTASELVNANQSGKPCLIVRPKNLAGDPKATLWRVQVAKRPAGDDPAGGIALSGTRDVAVTGNTFTGLAHPAMAPEGAESRQILFRDNLLAGSKSEHDKLLESDVSGNLFDKANE